MRFRAGCSMLATLTTLLKVWPAVRFCTPGSDVPTPLWQPEQMGVKICVCNCDKVTCAGGGGGAGVALLATVTVAVLELPTLPSASVARATIVAWPSLTVVVSQLTLSGA